MSKAAMSKASHAVLLLAAGQSQRLGQPKQLLHKNGITLIRHMAQLALATQPTRMIAVLAPEHFLQQPAQKLTQQPSNQTIAAQLENLPVQIVINEAASTGMASSLQVGASTLQDQQQVILIMGVDQPLLSAKHLNQLLMQYQTSAVLAVVSAYADTIGLPAVVSASLLQQSRHLTGDYGLKRLFMQHPESLSQVNAEALAFDIDTPDALQHARQQGWID